jgi:hypothetical protein
MLKSFLRLCEVPPGDKSLCGDGGRMLQYGGDNSVLGRPLFQIREWTHLEELANRSSSASAALGRETGNLLVAGQ